MLALKKVPVNISMNGLDEVSNIIDESCTRMDKNCKKLQKCEKSQNLKKPENFVIFKAIR